MENKAKIKLKFILPALIFWLCLVGAGVLVMARYVSQPSAQAAAPAAFPAAKFALDPHKPTLVMLAHPRCPCTRASLSELSALISHYPDRVKAYVFFYQPSSEPENWARTELWSQAEQISGVTVLPDFDAENTHLFGAFTSGQTLVYAPDGKLVFKGGITQGRGHEGENAGRAMIENYLQTGDSAAKTNFVYGCAITDDETSDNQIK